MRVLVLGATSFIGSHLVNNLANESENEVIAVVRDAQKAQTLLPASVKIVVCPMEKYRDLSEFVNGPVDWAILLSWASINPSERDERETQELSKENGLDAIRQLLQIGIKEGVITPGTQMEYGECLSSGEYMEDYVCCPTTPYGKAKLEFGEECSLMCRHNNIKHYHLRFFGVYGEDDRDRKLVNSVARAVVSGEIIKLDTKCEKQWNMLYIEDAVRAIKSFMIEKPASGIYNIASDDNRLLCDYLKALAQLAGDERKVVFGEKTDGMEMPRCSIKKALNNLNWRPRVDWDTGAKRIIGFYRDDD